MKRRPTLGRRRRTPPLSEYRRKRDFSRTREPRGGGGGRLRRPGEKQLSFYVQKHAARRLHFDFRLEMHGVLISWAVPKGPSLEPGVKRLAVHVEDHPLSYGSFAGEIPKGQYGAGTVEVWDRGTWLPEGDPEEGLKKGGLHFELKGKRLKGRWTLARMASKGDGQENWLLIKSKPTIPRPAEPAPSSAPPPPEPQLATLASAVPPGDGWLHELKLDGYRVLTVVQAGRARMYTRKGLDWTHRFGPLPDLLGRLLVRSAVFDGEVVTLDAKGRSSFSALQKALSEHTGAKLTYFAFDLLELDGRDLRPKPLIERKKALAKLLARAGPRLRLSEHMSKKGAALYKSACKLALEGIISKRADAPYRPGRGTDWLKVKCRNEQELIVAGYTEPNGSRSSFGALVLGVKDKGGLRHAGRVGTGFDQAQLKSLLARLRPLEVDDCPFAEEPSRAQTRGVRWVRPKLVAEVAFRGWTGDGQVRQASFKGLRDDKPAAEAVRETPAPAAPAAPRVTHPDRVLYPEIGLTKRELFDYYGRAAERMLPHVAGRPLMLLRCPSGRGRCFYQKHFDGEPPSGVRGVDVPEKDGTMGRYFCVDDAAGLMALAQLGALEFHPWGALADDVEKPERLTFDLDPGPGVPWKALAQAAEEVRRGLKALGLEGFLKTTGGKGLHVVAPLKPGALWPAAKRFARSFAAGLARAKPEAYTDKLAKSARNGRIFVDYLRNERGSTVVAPYSARARPKAPLSMPLTWDELTPSMRPDRFHLRSAAKRLAGPDPWAGFDRARRPLPKVRA